MRARKSRRELRGARGAILLLLASGLAASTWTADPEPASEPGASAWQTFEPEAGRFRARFPSQPRVTRSQRQTLVGKIQEARYASGANGLQYAVELRDLPALAGLLLSSEGILTRARAGLLEGSGGRLLDSDAAPHGGHPARRLRYALPGEPARSEQALLVLVGDRLYIAFATWSGVGPADARVQRFFEAFEVWSP